MTHPPGGPVTVPEYPSPTITDSRRLMGPNLLHPGLGAVLDVRLDDARTAYNLQLCASWHAHASRLCAALQWPHVQTVERRYPGGASLFVHAPIDQLMTATEVCETAWVLAEAEAGDMRLSADAALPRLQAMASAESNNALRALWNEAQRLRVNCTFGDARVCVGSGVGALCWPLDALPLIDDVPWYDVYDIPIALVTGSNGKTTVVRMIAAMARAEGHVVGYTCTDGVWIDGRQVEAGDWSGPVGARRVLQDKTVTLAVLESARGGMLRRGLALQQARVAAITTLAADHFGDYGIHDLASLAEAKLVVGRTVEVSETLIWNDGIPALGDALHSYRGHAVPLGPDHGDLGLGFTVADLAAIPATLGGSAAHNVLNARVAIAVASTLDFGSRAREALLRFGRDASDNVGRLMVQRIGGVTFVIDYAHNAQGVAALVSATRQLPAVRRAITLGTGGDRDDVALGEMARAAIDGGPFDLYIAKEIPRVLRGRAPGTTSRVLLDALHAHGADPAQCVGAGDDLTAARIALDWAKPGDLVLLATHDQRDAVLALLAEHARAASQ